MDRVPTVPVPPIPTLRIVRRPTNARRNRRTPRSLSARAATPGTVPASTRTPRMSPVQSPPLSARAAAYTEYGPGGDPLPTPEDTIPRLPLEAQFPVLRKTHPLSAGRGGGAVFIPKSAARTPTATALVDRWPKIDLPLRVDAPPHFAAPQRKPLAPRKPAIVSPTAISRGAAFGSRYDVKNLQSAAAAATGSPTKGPLRIKSDRRQTSANRQLRDALMLAAAAKRSGLTEKEAIAHFSVGVIRDNMESYSHAVSAYQSLLKLCEGMGYRAGSALALNAIGVDYHLMGMNHRGTERGQDYFELALDAHKRHAKLVGKAGVFVAKTNLALALGQLGRHAEAAKEHQAALQLAISLCSPFGQAVAVGNLGLTSQRAGDHPTAKACLDQYLSLVRTLGDKVAEVEALQHLGHMAEATADFTSAGTYFKNARSAATRAGSLGTASTALCRLGVAVGMGRIDAVMESLLAKAAKASHRPLIPGEPDADASSSSSGGGSVGGVEERK